MSRLLSAPLILVSLAIAMGSGVDALVKGLAPRTGLHHLIAWRFLFGALIALSLFLAQKRPLPSVEAVRFHTLRGVIQLICAFLFFYALTQLPLAIATIIGFSAALMVPFVARLLLSETIRPAILMASLAGFAGVVLAIQGGRSETAGTVISQSGIAACIASALLYAFVLVLLRMRATHEDATTIAMFTNLVPAVLMLPVTIGLFGPVNPGHLPLFAILGILGFVVWYMMTLGYARASAQSLAPLEYTALIWSALYGALLFGERPGWQSWAGALVIIGCCLFIAFEARLTTPPSTLPPDQSETDCS